MPVDYKETRQEYLARIASWYYDQNKNQQEIADQIGVTRSAISRLLAEARTKGIIEIVVHYPWRTSSELEAALVSTFKLKAACVLVRENKTYAEMLTGLGVLAAHYATPFFHDKMVIGVSWGSALHQMILAIKPMALPGAQVIQLVGGTGAERSSIDGPLLAPLLANNLGCSCRYLYAPLITETEAGREALLQDRSIRETLEKAENSDLAAVGIGTMVHEYYNPMRLGYVNAAEFEEVRSAGVVGVICGHHFDIHGNVLDIDVNRRVVGVDPRALGKVPVVMGVAGDIVKAEAIFGALNGGYVNVLVTDDTAAQKVLQLEAEAG